MKTTATVFATLLISISVWAQNPAYQQAMGKALTEMGAAKSAADFQAAANAFDRIAKGSADQYLPDYYAALALINQNWRLETLAEKDAALDKAMDHIAKAQEKNPGSAEVEALNGYALMAKLSADPQSRGQEYTPKAMGSFGKARGMDPQNPRALVLMARMEMGTAQFFGSDMAPACGKAKESLMLFENEKPEMFDPSWGKEIAEEMVESCEAKK